MLVTARRPMVEVMGHIHRKQILDVARLVTRSQDAVTVALKPDDLAVNSALRGRQWFAATG
jgi:hypothetical protein